MIKFPFYQQLDAMDCGPACLRMIAKYYGKHYSLQSLREKSYITREGVSMLGISDAAESIGFRTYGVRINFDQLSNDVRYPCVLHWQQNHFVVLYKIQKKGTKDYKIFIADPAHGLIVYDKEEFLSCWLSTQKKGEEQGLCLLLEPNADFYKQEDEEIDKSGFRFLFSYLRPYKKYVLQLFISLFFASIVQLIFPFLTQSIIDIGINQQDLSFISLILFALLVLTLSRASVDFIRGWILLHLGSRVNIFLISDFLIKLMKLPIAFFDTKMIGDIIQRINDHRRIKEFLTTSTLNILFSIFSLLVFGIVLFIYSVKIFLIYISGSILYTLWVSIFMKKRRQLDNKLFAQMSHNQSNIFQLITGMQEIKLNNCEKQKRWEWENIQAKLFNIHVNSLSLTQYQQAGAILINEIKNILIIFIAAKATLEGQMTLGMMLAVQFILGQLNSPLQQLIEFLHSTQDAKISLERLGEIHKKKEEELPDVKKLTTIPSTRAISVENVSFQYEGPNSPFVIKNIHLEIPENKITAIVGISGSGKTTLIKLLLGFYPPVEGTIKIGNAYLSNIDMRFWRQKCGVVMQDGFIFSDSIANNIALSEESINKEKLLHAVEVANIRDYIETLPLGYNTKIGNEGTGLSQGQKQRILIARAIYKNPEFVYFDEATNALDANNELQIMKRLANFFQGKTVVIVAHRLSTVKNADQIVVLDKGEIAEKGTHSELSKQKGVYYNLVKNQLELGS